MKFFIPNVKNEVEAREIYEGTRKHISKQLGADLSPRRIFRLVHDDWDRATKLRPGSRKRAPGSAVAQVGEVYERRGLLADTVLCILYEGARKLYYVCTWTRGVRYDGPILVGSHEVWEVEDFDDA